jgi:DNA ligase (NAD+)
MLSLSNVNSTPQLLQWLERIRSKIFNEYEDSITEVGFITEPKLDGLSLSLRYEKDTTNGKFNLKWAATRGDGTEGQDVTHAVKSLQGIPKQVQSEGAATILEVRGEVILPTVAFEGLVKSNFSNARNAASGILQRKAKELDEEDCELRSKLKFYAYDVVGNDKGLVDSAEQLRSWLNDSGFDVPQPFQFTTLPIANDTEWNETDILPMLAYYQDLERHRQGEKSTYGWDNYEMDGVVHKISQLDLRNLLGTTNRSPRWAVAHKFPSETALTSLIGLEIQVGRTGALTPVAILEKVDIAGVSVKRATLHNFGFLQQLMGGKSIPKGTKVLVRRAGDVIPQVVQRVLDSKDATTISDSNVISLEAPDKCPACGSPTAIIETVSNNTNSTTQGQVVRCVGPSLSCPPRAVGALAHAFSRDALDAKGLSEAKIQQLMNAGLLKVPADLFKLASRQHISDTILSSIGELPGWGEKSAKNLAAVASKIATNGVSLPRFIYSLGIRHAGQHTSKLIASTYGSADTFLLAVEDAASNNETAFAALVGSNETEGIKGIGPAQISALRSFANEVESVKAARQLANAIPVRDEVISISVTEPSEDKPWAGYRVVFTGTLPDGMSRKEAQDIAKAHLGAKSTPGSISKSTDLVVAGEKGGKKLEQAHELGVRVMDASTFMKLVQDHTDES